MSYKQEVLFTGEDTIPAMESRVESMHFKNEPGPLVRRPLETSEIFQGLQGCEGAAVFFLQIVGGGVAQDGAARGHVDSVMNLMSVAAWRMDPRKEEMKEDQCLVTVTEVQRDMAHCS